MKYGIWNAREPEMSAVNALVGGGYAPLAAMVLASRGIRDCGQAHQYLDCDAPLPDPFLMTDMDLAAYDNSSCCAEEMDLYNALERLSDEEKKIVQLRYFQGLKLEEVADAMGLKLSTVKSKLYRAMEKLRFTMTA